ncbi:MAG: hypothetical protein ACE145_03155 [Terriglobia bacterium]
MTLKPLTVACPQCGSNDVFYSCKPECCFNHVCNNCYTTFELATTRIGELQDAFPMLPDPDPSAPTAPCARCGEYRIFGIRDGSAAPPRYLCVACKALLTLQITNVAKG